LVAEVVEDQGVLDQVEPVDTVAEALQELLELQTQVVAVEHQVVVGVVVL
jgi:hypothetical protein